jgi:hypothetical protein
LAPLLTFPFATEHHSLQRRQNHVGLECRRKRLASLSAYLAVLQAGTGTTISSAFRPSHRHSLQQCQRRIVGLEPPRNASIQPRHGESRASATNAQVLTCQPGTQASERERRERERGREGERERGREGDRRRERDRERERNTATPQLAVGALSSCAGHTRTPSHLASLNEDRERNSWGRRAGHARLLQAGRKDGKGRMRDEEREREREREYRPGFRCPLPEGVAVADLSKQAGWWFSSGDAVAALHAQAQARSLAEARCMVPQVE